MSNFEHRITEDSTEFEKVFLKIYDGSLWTTLNKMKDWQPPKPLVVVPQIVADFIKTLKIKGIKPLMDSATFGEIGFTEEKRDEILHWINEHQEEYMRAWLDDYTVEKERMYVLMFPKKVYPYISFYDHVNEIINWTDNLDNAKRFTEKEIRAIDDRYWAFAVKVEEVES